MTISKSHFHMNYINFFTFTFKQNICNYRVKHFILRYTSSKYISQKVEPFQRILPSKFNFAKAGFRQSSFHIGSILISSVWREKMGTENAFLQMRFMILRESRFLFSRFSQNTPTSMNCLHRALPRYTLGIIELVKYGWNRVTMCNAESKSKQNVVRTYVRCIQNVPKSHRLKLL